MRVVQVNYASDPTLATADELLDQYTTLTGWADALAAAGVDVLTVQQFHSSANVTRGGLSYTFGDFSAIASAAAAFKPDIVHVNGLIFPLRTWRLARHTDAAVVIQDHASGVPHDVAPVRAVRRRLMRAANAFLFSASAQAEPWRAAGLIQRQRVYEVMEASTWLRPARRDVARAATGIIGSPAVLWVGRLNANKDPLTVLAGFELAAEQLPDATLTMIYHTDELLAPVRGRVAESSTLRERVRLVGVVPHDQMSAYFSSADIFVVGSHHEGSGYSLMEALACGAIPVVTNIPAFRALTGDIGHLWTPGDVDGCAQALLSVDAAERWRVIEHFEKNLTWNAVGKRAVEIYDDVVQNVGRVLSDPA